MATSYERADLDIILPPDNLKTGWKLIQGILRRRSGDYNARLYFDLGAGFSDELSFRIPTTGKGVIHEVLLFPAGIKRLRFSPMSSVGESECAGISVSNIGSAKRIIYMGSRVLAAIWQHPWKKRKLIGLSLFRSIFDLEGAYCVSGNLLAHAAAPSYQQWIAAYDVLSSADRRDIARHITRFSVMPCFEVLIDATVGDDAALARTRTSMAQQLYDKFSVSIIDNKGWGSNIADDRNDLYVIILRAGDVLAAHALYWLACVAEGMPDAGLIYSDEDRLDEEGRRCDPRLKPDWSPELHRSTNYMGQLVAVRTTDLARAGGLHADDVIGDNHDLLLRVSERLSPEHIVHVPAVLIHRPAGVEMRGELGAIQAHLGRSGVIGDVDRLSCGGYRVRYALPSVFPMVSILIPTRDQVDLVRQCVDSILEKSSYPRYEVLILDNRSTDVATLAYLASVSSDPRVRVLRYDAPFNFAAINNFAAQHAEGEVLCLLNNDTEVISPDWMEEMLGHLVQDKVGVVGAKLLYPDGRVQHGGDVVGVGGVANHLHAFLGRDDPGYCNRAIVAQDLSAVTAACMMTWRKLYLDMGGMDEQNLPVAFNDVDYCLRVRESGHRVVWTPHAELYHHESVSRGKDDTPEKQKRAKGEVAYMRKRWKHVLQNDPFYNPNLSFERADFSLSHAPLVQRPWRK